MLKINKIFKLIAGFTFSFVFGLDASLACRPGEFNDSKKSEAKIVFIGTPVSYKTLVTDKKDRPLEAEVTFKVEKSLKGEPSKTIKFRISTNTDTSIPSTLKQFVKCYGEKSEVGLIQSSLKEQPVFKVVQGPCHPPYILPIGKPKPLLCIFD